jgi:hypothetical protein
MVVVNKCMGQMMYEAEPKLDAVERILHEALEKLVEYRKIFDEIISKYIGNDTKYIENSINIDTVSCEIMYNI